jgi:hypothetical protein
VNNRHLFFLWSYFFVGHFFFLLSITPWCFFFLSSFLEQMQPVDFLCIYTPPFFSRLVPDVFQGLGLSYTHSPSLLRLLYHFVVVFSGLFFRDGIPAGCGMDALDDGMKDGWMVGIQSKIIWDLKRECVW